MPYRPNPNPKVDMLGATKNRWREASQFSGSAIRLAQISNLNHSVTTFSVGTIS